MDTHFLTTFVMVVDRGSMAAAARQLNITPAAVAQQIRTLERELGAPLIARAGRTVSVTEAGTRILERARELLRDLEANGHGSAPSPETQLTLFALPETHPAVERLRTVDVDRTTPLQALSLLAELARAAKN